MTGVKSRKETSRMVTACVRVSVEVDRLCSVRSSAGSSRRMAISVRRGDGGDIGRGYLFHFVDLVSHRN